MVRMTFKKRLLEKLIAATLTLFTITSNANYAEIGYTKHLSVNTLMRINSFLYVNAESSRNIENIGVGIGYRIRSLNTVATYNSDESAKIDVMYYDRGIPYFIGVKKSFVNENKLSFKIGVGYPINEKVSLITHYSDNGLFVGVRRWL